MLLHLAAARISYDVAVEQTLDTKEMARNELGNP